jgi:type VI secretion system secreted protein Hcp
MGAEWVEHGDIVIHKPADLASPILMQTCSTRKTIAKAKNRVPTALQPGHA